MRLHLRAWVSALSYAGRVFFTIQKWKHQQNEDQFHIQVTFSSTDKTLTLDTEKVMQVPTTNTQYFLDATLPLEGILELEFGFCDSLPAIVATLAANMANGYQVPMETAMYIGTAVGRGAFELSKYFKKVGEKGWGEVLLKGGGGGKEVDVGVVIVCVCGCSFVYVFPVHKHMFKETQTGNGYCRIEGFV